jgi:hypothetical protein
LVVGAIILLSVAIDFCQHLNLPLLDRTFHFAKAGMFTRSIFRDNAFTVLVGDSDVQTGVNIDESKFVPTSTPENELFHTQFILSEITTVQSALRRIARSSYSTLSLSSPFRNEESSQAKVGVPVLFFPASLWLRRKVDCKFSSPAIASVLCQVPPVNRPSILSNAFFGRHSG